MKDFKPEHYSNTRVITLNGNINEIFPLFTPEGEVYWVEGWTYDTIYAEKETTHKGMIFTTKSPYLNEEKMHWIVSKFDEENYDAEYTVFSHHVVIVVYVNCRAAGDKTEAEITYTLTGLTDAGNEAARGKTEDAAFTEYMNEWEVSINNYLEKEPA